MRIRCDGAYLPLQGSLREDRTAKKNKEHRKAHPRTITNAAMPPQMAIRFTLSNPGPCVSDFR